MMENGTESGGNFFSKISKGSGNSKSDVRVQESEARGNFSNSKVEVNINSLLLEL